MVAPWSSLRVLGGLKRLWVRFLFRWRTVPRPVGFVAYGNAQAAVQGRVIESFLALARQGREGRNTAGVRRMVEAADDDFISRVSLWKLTTKAV